jgi:hypothetical protein
MVKSVFPGRIFEKHAVDAVKTTVVADISPDLALVGMLRDGNRIDIEFIDFRGAP